MCLLFPCYLYCTKLVKICVHDKLLTTLTSFEEAINLTCSIVHVHCTFLANNTTTLEELVFKPLHTALVFQTESLGLFADMIQNQIHVSINSSTIALGNQLSLFALTICENGTLSRVAQGGHG
jgi:hypothetical protein